MATAKNTAKAETAAKTKKSALGTLQDSVTERTSAVREQVTERLDTVRGTVGQAAGVAVDFSKAYYSGINVLGKTLFGFGKEFYGETTEHVQKTMRAKCLSEVAGLQAAYLQSRIETSATHGKEFIDVARVQAEETMKPVIQLLDGQRTA